MASVDFNMIDGARRWRNCGYVKVVSWINDMVGIHALVMGWIAWFRLILGAAEDSSAEFTCILIAAVKGGMPIFSRASLAWQISA